MKNWQRNAYVAGLILGTLAMPVAAADTAADTNAQQALKTKDVVVTATRTEAEVKTVPNTVEVITSDDIKRLGAIDVASALRLADNIQILSGNAGAGFGHKIMMRGMGADSLLILVNGQRVADEDTGTTHNAYALDRINVNNVERIEIVRGAASAQYGSDALAGVINIITKQSEKSDPSVTVGVNTGTTSMNNYYHVDLGKHGKFSGTFDMQFTKERDYGSYSASEGIKEDILSGNKQYYNFSGNYEVAKNRNLNLSMGYYKDKLSAPWNWTSARSLANYGAMSDAKSETERRDISLSYSGKTKNDDWFVRTYYSKLNRERGLPYAANVSNYLYTMFNRFMHQNVASLAGTRTDENNKFSFWGMEAKDSHKIGYDHTLTFGGEYNKYQVSGNNFSSTDQGSGADFNTWAGYVQDEWLVGDKWVIIPAIRYDKNSRYGGKTTPRIGATYLINEHNRLKANWGKGYKAPTVSQLFMDYMHMVEILGNPDLKPETSKGYDLSYEGEWGKTSGKITYFNNRIEDMISYKAYIGRWIDRYYNMDGTTKLHGIELTLNQELSPRWSAKVTSNWTSASSNAKTSTDGHAVNGIADNVTTLQFIYDDHKDTGWTGILYEQWLNKYYDTDSAKYYTYNTMGVTITRKFNKDTRAFFGLDNIFNKKINDIYLYGRAWTTGVEFKF